MKYIFFGTPEFSAIILDRLIRANMPPSLVVTNPDKPAGRAQALTSPAVKKVAERRGIPILQPDALKTKNPATDLLYQEWDFFLVVAYGKIIPKSVLDIPRLGVLNVHPSLLPKYRGPTPIQTAILNGDDTTGVSIMLLDEEVDHGPVLAKRKLRMIHDDDYDTLARKLAELGAKMLIEILPKYVAGKITPMPQDHAKATYTKKFTTEDAFVPYENLTAALNNDTEKAGHINRMIRALNPEPGVWTKTSVTQISDLPKNKRVKLLESEMRDGKLQLQKIQTEGQKPRSL